MLSFHTCPLGKAGSRDTGGMSVYLREVSRCLGDLGFLVDLFTRDRGKVKEGVKFLGQNTRLVHLKAGPGEPLSKEELYAHTRAFALEVEEFRRRNGLRYDLIYSNYWLSGVTGLYLQEWWNSVHALMYHTLGELKNRALKEIRVQGKEREPRIRLRWEEELFHRCHLVVAPTGREKELMERQFGAEGSTPVRVIPCGVDMNHFRPMDKNEARQSLGVEQAPAILTVGRADPVKGTERLLESLSLLPREKRPYLLVVGGEENGSPYRDKLMRRVEELSLAERVLFKGVVGPELMPYYYNSADLCVVASYYESFGLVALESLACGTPVLATDVGGMREIINGEEGGHVLEEGTPEEMARAMETYMNRNGPNQTYNVRRSVVPYRWPRVARLLAGAFEEAVSGISPE